MKPGLYVATVEGVPGVRVIHAPSAESEAGTSLAWRRVEPAENSTAWLLADDITDARPLVVLDPESDKERLARAMWVADNNSRTWDAMPEAHGSYLENAAAVLRALAVPTPAEPMGLGAVVRDRGGWLWVKWSTTHREDRNWKHESRSGDYQRWDALDSPEVLSEGWSE